MFVFFFSSGDQSQEAKTKFGYIRDMKVGKKTRNPSIFLATYRKLSLKKSNDFGKKRLLQKSRKFGPFFPLKILCIGRNHIFSGRNLVKFCPKKNTPERRGKK